MPTETEAKASAVEAYLDLFEALSRLGVEFVIIGGCAVGAYARFIGETIFSLDLDMLVTERTLEMMLDDWELFDAELVKRPQPRTLPVAVFRWRGREVNVLSETVGLSPADVEARTARELELERGIRVLLADPFDLLRNKLAVNRPKDQPHIAVLRRFIDEEIVNAMTHEHEPRARIGPAERLLSVLGERTLGAALATRIIALARDPSDFRFLAHRVPAVDHVAALMARAPTREIREAIEVIARRRGLV